MKTKMKMKLLPLLFALLLSCAGCAGGAAQDAGSPQNGSAQSGQSEETRAVPAADAPAEDADGNASAGGVLDMMGAQDEVELYRPVLDRCCSCLLYKTQDDDWYEDVPTGLQELRIWLKPEEAMDTVGYWYSDLNGDGTPELLVGLLDATEGEEPSARGNVMGCYTVIDGEIVCVLEGWNRNTYQWLGENRFLNCGSGGAMYSAFGTFRLPPDARELVCEDFYFTWEKDEDYTEVAYYHNTTGEWDREKEEELDITGEALWAMQEKLTDETRSIPYTPFSQYRYADTLPGLSEYEDVTAADVPVNAKAVFFADEPVSDFKLLALSFVDSDEYGHISYDISEVYGQDTLTPARPLVAPLEMVGTIPNNGFSYVDQNGETHRFSVSESGRDGSLLVQPLD